ncbi:MAG TPA: hypothetical protein VMR14_00030 [Streptosporangiaceae bacterium]|jgi:hypothetical protein|nr:hypothetical protein [Streptosporangiaceae bacterium]
MTTTTTGPPFVPIRRGGWPTRRAPRWAIVAGVVLLAIAVAVGLAHRPTKGERASDLNGLLTTVNTDVESCAGGVGDALRVLNAIDSGASHDVATAISIAQTGSANCSPANNEELDDLTGLEVPESLDGYHLQAAVTDLINWTAPDAANVQADVATVLTDRGTSSEPAARAALARALARLRAQRGVVYAAFAPAIKALSPHVALPRLWVTARPPNSY